MRRKSNPFGLDLGDFVGPVLLLGGIYVGAQLLQGLPIIPGQEQPKEGTGGPGGVGGYIGDTQFRISHFNFDGFLLPGSTINVVWMVDHIGKAGKYVVGLDIVPFHFACVGGLHNAPVQTIEAEIMVNDDPGWASYKPSASVPLSGPVHWTYDIRGFVRDAQGNQLADAWICGGLIVA